MRVGNGHQPDARGDDGIRDRLKLRLAPAIEDHAVELVPAPPTGTGEFLRGRADHLRQVAFHRGTEHDRVHALEIGADDYLVKPFSMKELVARVGAAARRGTRAGAAATTCAERLVGGNPTFVM